VLAAIAALALSGCISQALLASDYASLQKELQFAHSLTNCAPKDLAIADSNMAFAELEFQQGDTRRAWQHIQIAREHAKIAGECPPIPKAAPPPPPPPKPPPKPSDSDGDGVLDNDDQCVNDPEDLDGFKDSDGCPEPDNDLDGILDLSDRCPLEPEDRDGFEDADGCPEPDNDRDGCPDTADACPLEPGLPAQNCCPVRDRDGDGLADPVDRCPDQPENINQYLDEDGCPDVKPQRIEITGDQIVIKQRINFATGKSTILPDSFVVLDDVAQVLQDYPKLRIEIGGHTDNVGDEAYNQRLSKARADAVFEYMLKKGVAASRMLTQGYGESRPIDTNMTDSGKLANRRVEFVIIKDDLQAPTPG